MGRRNRQSPPEPCDIQITSKQLAARWGVRDVSIRMLRSQGRGPQWITLGPDGQGRRPRVRYWLSEVRRYERQHGRSR